VELVRAIVERHAALAQAAECPIALEARVPVIGCWDRPRMEQAVAHLLSNAIKYGAGRPITVRVDGDGASGRVVVQDQGLGISAEDLDRIFGRFERAAPSRHYGGLGLGLYVARQIVQAHGGEIEVASEPGHGATFTVAVPRWPEAPGFEGGAVG
jgi:signal transduction histidine kinase